MNYRYCTLDELVEHLVTCKPQAITQQVSYYRKKGDETTVNKIQKGRILAKIVLLQGELELLNAE